LNNAKTVPSNHPCLQQKYFGVAFMFCVSKVNHFSIFFMSKYSMTDPSFIAQHYVTFEGNYSAYVFVSYMSHTVRPISILKNWPCRGRFTFDFHC